MSVLRIVHVLILLAWCVFASHSEAQSSAAFGAIDKPGGHTGQLVVGTSPQLGSFFGGTDFPRLNFEFGRLEFFVSDNLVTGRMLELSIQFSETSPIVPLTNVDMTYNFFINSDGDFVGGINGDDFSLSADADIDGDGIVDFSGLLLAGEVVLFSAKDGGGNALDHFFVSIQLTGGQLADAFGGGIVSALFVAHISAFTGDWDDDLKIFFNDGYLVGDGSMCTGTIGDYVWVDADGNGIQDDGEEGINGVSVILTDQNGQTFTVETITGGPTNSPGYYQFSGLCAGDYVVSVDPATVPAGLNPTMINAPGSNPGNDSNDPSGTVVTLPTDNSSNQETDFGYVANLGSLGDFVWLDLDQDGIQDPGEVGIEGVTVNLLDCNGAQLATMMTDSTGFYEFTDLVAGCYLVEFELPVGFEFSPQFAGPFDTDSNPNVFTGVSDPITLGPGEDNPTIDAGLFQPATSSLGDFVWFDENMDGFQDPGEDGIPNVFVTLLDCKGNVLDTTMTDADGGYEFTDLPAGCYKVMFTLPDGFMFSPQNGGPTDQDSDANPSNGMSGMINLGVNENNPTIDAGMFELVSSSLGDYFWLDTNGDGIQDTDEMGIEGVSVLLFDCNGTLLDAVQTNADGMYLFDDLVEGCYRVTFNAPIGCVLSPMGSGGDTALDSNANPATGQTDQINLGVNQSDLTIDAGCYFTAGLGDYVWNDENQDGIQDPTEEGIPGLLVELLDMNMDPTGMTAITGPNGEYSFTDLSPGKYFVQFTTAAGFVFTSQNSGGDDALDSNANGTGKTNIIMLDSGQFDPTIDAGMFQPQDPMIDIEKSTNGFDADDPTGPYVQAGGVVTWVYTVTNTGTSPLSDIVVTDTVLGTINCPFTTLDPGDSDDCMATGIAVVGQYMNGSDVIGFSPTGVEVVDNDPSHYFGSNPSIDIEKATNDEDADDPTGPLVPVGSVVTWTYEVVNDGNVPLINIMVTDSDPTVQVDCPLTELQVIGAGVSSMTCMATGIAQLGQYENDSMVVGTPPVGEPVTDDDPSHYFGIDASITIEKQTNGFDADDPNDGQAPQLEPGDLITWTYLVTNTGNVTLTGVEVEDDQGVVVNCPQDTLLPQEDMLCSGLGAAVDLSDPDVPNVVQGVCGITPNSNLYENLGTVVGTTPNGNTVTDDDPSHYCNPNLCSVEVDATCLIPMPPASDYTCEKPIDTLTFIWSGSSSVRIKAWKGSVGSTQLADIDDIAPGQEVSVSGFAGSPNDVFFEVFNAGSSTKIGESKFHLSCSDSAMNGPEDCGAPQGDGKDNSSNFINNWLLEGIVDQGGVLDCTPADTAGTDSCSFSSFPASCDTIDNVDTITLKYTGGTCAGSQNTQGDKFDCDGSLDPALPALVILDGGSNFMVSPGESFTIPETGSGTEVSMTNSGGMMNLNIHTSCSAPLNTGDVFGAVTLLQINNMGDGTDVIYSYTITNSGDTDIVSLSALDIPLGPVPGVPDFLAAGDSVTLHNTAFVDTTTNSSVVVDAQDVNGATCSAQDSTMVNILPPPPCEVTGEGFLEVDGDRIKWRLENIGGSTATLDTLTVSWPENFHGRLKEIKLDGDKIYDTLRSGGAITLGASDWINNPDKRRISPGDDPVLEIKFEENNDNQTNADDYSISVGFEQGCSVDFVNVGLPFSCTKPIDELVMIWDGSTAPVSIKAWKGNVGSTLLHEQSNITAGTEVAVSGYAGSPNDVYWEVFSGGTKLGESNFHMSCSDNNMNGAEDCGKRQGNGKSDSNILLNEWLLEGMTDQDGTFDCTP